MPHSLIPLESHTTQITLSLSCRVSLLLLTHSFIHAAFRGEGIAPFPRVMHCKIESFLRQTCSLKQTESEHAHTEEKDTRLPSRTQKIMLWRRETRDAFSSVFSLDWLTPLSPFPTERTQFLIGHELVVLITLH